MQLILPKENTNCSSWFAYYETQIITSKELYSELLQRSMTQKSKMLHTPKTSKQPPNAFIKSHM